MFVFDGLGEARSLVSFFFYCFFNGLTIAQQEVACRSSQPCPLSADSEITGAFRASQPGIKE